MGKVRDGHISVHSGLKRALLVNGRPQTCFSLQSTVIAHVMQNSGYKDKAADG